MNERIKELANEAWQYANNNSRDGDDTHGWLYRDKFAELIIQECATVARKHSLQKYSGMEDYDGVVFVEETIKKHFSAEK